VLGHEIGAEILNKFLPAALTRGKFVCAPEPQTIGAGLEHVQEAFDIFGKGVSAKKIVLTI
jgi:hypothetical protein